MAAQLSVNTLFGTQFRAKYWCQLSCPIVVSWLSQAEVDPEKVNNNPGQRPRCRRTRSAFAVCCRLLPASVRGGRTPPVVSPFASSLSEAGGQPPVTGCGQPATAGNCQAQVLVCRTEHFEPTPHAGRDVG